MKNTNTLLMQSTIETDQDSSNQQSEMRVLTESEMLSVAGGPEVDVESGGGG
ncbi:hypothetical protein [Undibacterium pigrum]|nr:hypothetical protein [Undibacterium pigrum]